MKVKSLRQHWSRGQCNIVDHRKLVLVINNDKTNKGGSVVGRLRVGQQQEEVGFSYSGTGLSRVLKGQDMKEARWAARIPFNTWICRGKNCNPGPLFLCSCSQVFF